MQLGILAPLKNLFSFLGVSLFVIGFSNSSKAAAADAGRALNQFTAKIHATRLAEQTLEQCLSKSPASAPLSTCERQQRSWSAANAASEAAWYQLVIRSDVPAAKLRAAMELAAPRHISAHP